MADLRPEGLDFSRWNPGWNPEVSLSRGIKYVGVRRSVGNYYKDAIFPEYYAKAKSYNLPIMSYHVVNPMNSAQSQMKWAFDTLSGFEVDRFVLDVEVIKGQTPRRITDIVYGCVAECRNRGVEPVIYTSAGFWNYQIISKPVWETLDLWVANYGNIVAPYIPKSWKDVGWKLWQYSADGNYKGAYYGVESRHVDVNKFNGTLAELYVFLDIKGDVPVPPVPPVPPVEPEQAFIEAYLWRTATRLNVRRKPSTSSSVVRTLPANTIVEEVERVEIINNLWARIGNDQYCAIEYNGINYLTPVFEE